MTIKLFSPETQEPANRNLWKILTIALVAFVALGVVVSFAIGYFSEIGANMFHTGNGIFTGLLGVVLGIAAMAFAIAVPIILLILISMIVGYGFGVGFSASEAGKAIVRRGRVP